MRYEDVMDERQKMLYYKLRSQMLSIAVIEVLLGIFIWAFMTFTIEIFFVLLSVPILFYRLKLYTILDVKDIKILGDWVLAGIWFLNFGINIKNYMHSPERYQDVNMVIISGLAFALFLGVAMGGAVIKRKKCKEQEEEDGE